MFLFNQNFSINLTVPSSNLSFQVFALSVSSVCDGSASCHLLENGEEIVLILVSEFYGYLLDGFRCVCQKFLCHGYPHLLDVL